jgi:hypothetical protein
MKYSEFERRSRDYDRQTEVSHAPYVLGAILFLGLMFGWGAYEFFTWAMRVLGRILP